LRLLRVRGSAGPYLLTRMREHHPGPILLVTSSSQAAERWATDLRSFGIQGDSAIFARYDTPPFDRFSPHPDIEANRMSLLYRLLAATPTTSLCVIAPWTALLRRGPSRAELRGRVTHLERVMKLDRDALLEVLVSAGYHRRSLVEERGEVASRGGILDLFPPHLPQPLRI